MSNGVIYVSRCDVMWHYCVTTSSNFQTCFCLPPPKNSCYIIHLTLSQSIHFIKDFCCLCQRFGSLHVSRCSKMTIIFQMNCMHVVCLYVFNLALNFRREQPTKIGCCYLIHCTWNQFWDTNRTPKCGYKQQPLEMLFWFV